MIIFSRENFLSICRIEMNKWFFQRTFQGPLRNSVSELLQRRWRRRGGDAANLNGIFNRQSLASFDKFSNQIQKQKIIKTLKNHRKNRICKQHYNIFQLVVLNIYIYVLFFAVLHFLISHIPCDQCHLGASLTTFCSTRWSCFLLTCTMS